MMQNFDTTMVSQTTSQVFYPWRRYLARILDLALYDLAWTAFLMLGCHMNIASLTGLEKMFISFLVVALMLVCEPLMLHLFGTTLGKSLFGLRVFAPNGKHLSYRAGLERTWGMIGAGLGYNIPVYSLIRLWKSYQLCKQAQPQPWDETVCYTIRDTKRYRAVMYVGAYVAMLGILVIIFNAQKFPPNRGDLTVAQFSENYRYFASYLEIDSGENYLDENGKWAKKPVDGTVYFDVYANPPPEFEYIIQNGVLTGVSFVVEINNSKEWMSSYDTPMMLASLAFAYAQPEVGLFSNTAQRILQQIEQNSFQDFIFTEAGISFACDTEYSGYTATTDLGLLLPEENAAVYDYKVIFSMKKER